MGVHDEREVGDLVRQRRRQEKVQEDLRSLPLVLLCTTSATTTHMTSRAGGAAEDEAAVMHLLTPALRPDPRSSGVGLYIASEPEPKIASEANQNEGSFWF